VHTRSAIVFALALGAAVSASPRVVRADDLPPPAPLNILFYGNSYTLSNGGVDRVVRDLAAIAGLPVPRTVSAAISGYSFTEHLATNLAVINQGIPASQNWNFVVLQDLSTMPTRIGNVQQHINTSRQVYLAVAARSWAVRPVMFETWARRSDNAMFYGGPFSFFPRGPSQMQTELRNGYLQSSQVIDAEVFPGWTQVAFVGDAWQAAGYSNLYISDQTHPNARGTYLAGMVLFSQIYNRPVGDLNVGAFAARYATTPAGAVELAAAADQIFYRPAPVYEDPNPPPPPPPPPSPECIAADFNADGSTDPDDLADFIGAFFSAPPLTTADFNQSSDVDPDDLADYIGVFFGC